MKEWLGVSQKSFYQNANPSFTIPKIVIVSTNFVDFVKHIFEITTVWPKRSKVLKSRPGTDESDFRKPHYQELNQ